ncbi:unnamed protein product [Allacma fusca]|uniref:Uncharacterized protein n=1 Tax=Allacma fusca TaxID=39272 RepID=A0A8J2K1H7_9HEXA|nr:unnamed protein product [Allacma fusca]
MKMIAVFTICIAVAAGAPSGGYGTPAAAPSYGSLETKEALPLKPIIPIESMSSDSDHKGVYNFNYKSGDGSQVQVAGSLRDLGDQEGPVNVKQGSYSFTAPDKKVYTVNWTSDENGFHATGDHLPTSPPIPDDINKSIDRSALPADHHLVLQSGALPLKNILGLRSSYGGY